METHTKLVGQAIDKANEEMSLAITKGTLETRQQNIFILELAASHTIGLAIANRMAQNKSTFKEASKPFLQTIEEAALLSREMMDKGDGVTVNLGGLN